MKSKITNLKKAIFLMVIGVIASFAMINETNAQSVSAKNAIYIELGGNGLFYSVNYDHRFNTDWSARGGIMYASFDEYTFTVVPLLANYLVGNNHMLEIGAGVSYLGIDIKIEGEEFLSFSGSAIAGTGNIGYRYQNVDGGFVFRIGFTPLFSQHGFAPWAGLSLGYAF